MTMFRYNVNSSTCDKVFPFSEEVKLLFQVNVKPSYSLTANNADTFIRLPLVESRMSQRERLHAELEYMERLRGIKRRREVLPHRAQLDLLMGGKKVEFNERFVDQIVDLKFSF